MRVAAAMGGPVTDDPSALLGGAMVGQPRWLQRSIIHRVLGPGDVASDPGGLGLEGGDAAGPGDRRRRGPSVDRQGLVPCEGCPGPVRVRGGADRRVAGEPGSDGTKDRVADSGIFDDSTASGSSCDPASYGIINQRIESEASNHA